MLEMFHSQLENGSIAKSIKPDKISVKYPVALIAVFLWIGFVLAISFMDSWLSFRASGETVSNGLSIERLVFGALNKNRMVLFCSYCFELCY
ncbi:MAG: hypothetical protein H7321_10045 [Bacteroidia bacterium]|nr:hypothetical protein [Bacteroidia bacterium]